MTDEQINETIKEFLERQYYTDITILPGDNICAIHPFIYTWGVCYGVNFDGYKGRFCFDSLVNAQGFLRGWDGKIQPTVGEGGCTAIK